MIELWVGNSSHQLLTAVPGSSQPNPSQEYVKIRLRIVVWTLLRTIKTVPVLVCLAGHRLYHAPPDSSPDRTPTPPPSNTAALVSPAKNWRPHLTRRGGGRGKAPRGRSAWPPAWRRTTSKTNIYYYSSINSRFLDLPTIRLIACPYLYVVRIAECGMHLFCFG